MKNLVETIIYSLKKPRKSKSKDKPITMGEYLDLAGFSSHRIIIINGEEIDPKSKVGKKVTEDMDRISKDMDSVMGSYNEVISNAMNMMDKIFKAKERSEK